jgi:hypothetical protein
MGLLQLAFIGIFTIMNLTLADRWADEKKKSEKSRASMWTLETEMASTFHSEHASKSANQSLMDMTATANMWDRFGDLREIREKVHSGNDTKPSKGEVEGFQRLFAKLNGKTVVFAGDSLMYHIFEFIMDRGAPLLRWTVSNPVANAFWLSETGVVTARSFTKKEQDDEEWKDALGFNPKTKRQGFYHQAFEFKGTNEAGAVMSFTAEVLYFHRFPEPVMNELFGHMVHANVVYLNLGHVAICPDAWTLEQFKSLASKVVDKATTNNVPVVFVEHPPSHFNTPHGDYAWYSGQKIPPGCKCHPIDEMLKQYSYTCERVWLDPFARRHGLITAKWFDGLIDSCDSHRAPGDCRHYQQSWAVYSKLTEALCIATDEISNLAKQKAPQMKQIPVRSLSDHITPTESIANLRSSNQVYPAWKDWRLLLAICCLLLMAVVLARCFFSIGGLKKRPSA